MCSTDKTLLLPQQTDVEYGETSLFYSSADVGGGGGSGGVEHTIKDSSSSHTGAATTAMDFEETRTIDFFHFFYLVLLIGYVVLYPDSALPALFASLIPISLWYLSKCFGGRQTREESAKKDSSSPIKPVVQDVVVKNKEETDEEGTVCDNCEDVFCLYLAFAILLGFVILVNAVPATVMFFGGETIFMIPMAGTLSGVPHRTLCLSQWTAKHKAAIKRFRKVVSDVQHCDWIILLIRCGLRGDENQGFLCSYVLAGCVAIFPTLWFLWRSWDFLQHFCRHPMQNSSNSTCLNHAAATPDPWLVGYRESELSETEDVLASNAQ